MFSWWLVIVLSCVIFIPNGRSLGLHHADIALYEGRMVYQGEEGEINGQRTTWIFSEEKRGRERRKRGFQEDVCQHES